MATTPTYSWPIPDDTDLVKDGAEAIRDLGNAIDTTVDGLPGAGLVHIDTQSFSAVSAVNFDDVFSADYFNYKIIFHATLSTSATVFLRFRTGGSNNTTANYSTRANLLGVGASSALNYQNGTSIELQVTTTEPQQREIFVENPFATIRTRGFSIGALGTAGSVQIGGIDFSQTTSFDGFSIAAFTANMAGHISVYGFAKD